MWGRTGFDGIESWWGGVPGCELPLNDRTLKLPIRSLHTLLK
jgi:hypothetical protein